MTKNSNYQVWKADKAFPIYGFTHGVEVEQDALEQVKRAARLPFIHHHIALMPDVHHGKGSTVGSVIPTKSAIIPAAVGVDIGCGMMAVKTSLKASDLPDSLFLVRSTIEAVVPHGRTDNGGPNDRGAWHDVPFDVAEVWEKLVYGLADITAKHPKVSTRTSPSKHLGTLGTGNHFIEMCLDEEGSVWIMLHSGSRGVGNRIGSYFIELAKEEMRRWHIDRFLEDQDLAYLVENGPHFNDYIEAVHWAQKFAEVNRQVMMRHVLRALQHVLPAFTAESMAINCHHNYVAKENHFGANVYVTRKGAVRARKDDLGIIPGSMGAKSFIVRGKGNPDSLHSCSHGAGRRMSRTQASKTFTLDDHAKATAHVECRKDVGVLDETPGAYKDIDAVMAAQTDNVEIVHTLRQIVCVKG
jgi:tRNA-splicing ligase RtcB